MQSTETAPPLNEQTRRLLRMYEVFPQAVPTYDDFRRTMLHHIIEWWQGQDTEAANALEIGTGTGVATEAVLSIHAGIDVTTIDLDPFAIEACRHRLQGFEGQLDLVCIDALEHLKDQADGSVDLIFTVWTLHNIEEPKRSKILRQMRRVLADGGMIIIGDKFAYTNVMRQESALHAQKRDIERFYSAANETELKIELLNHYDEDERRQFFMSTCIDVLRKHSTFETVMGVWRGGMEGIIIARK